MAEAVFVDKTVFLSFLTRDREDRFRAARDLFEQAESGRARLETTEVVLAEVAEALEARFSMPRTMVAEVMEAVLGTRNLRVPARKVLKRAVGLYLTGIMGFSDAYAEAYAYERGLKRAEGFGTQAQRSGGDA
jgi:predicted nucleic-acid-binding protein